MTSFHPTLFSSFCFDTNFSLQFPKLTGENRPLLLYLEGKFADLFENCLEMSAEWPVNNKECQSWLLLLFLYLSIPIASLSIPLEDHQVVRFSPPILEDLTDRVRSTSLLFRVISAMVSSYISLFHVILAWETPKRLGRIGKWASLEKIIKNLEETYLISTEVFKIIFAFLADDMLKRDLKQSQKIQSVTISVMDWHTHKSRQHLLAATQNWPNRSNTETESL